MKNGFTLIELLAVIVILAILATVTTPIVQGVINSSREKAFKNDAVSLYKAAQNYYSSATLDDDVKLPLLVTFNDKNETNKFINNTTSECDEQTTRMIEYSGKNPDSGNIYVSKSGDIEIAIYNKQIAMCARKKANEKTFTYTKENGTNCKLNKTVC